MSQNSIVIADGSGSAVRSAINNALDSLGTNFIGASRPSGIQAGQIWINNTSPSSSTWSVYFYDGSHDVKIGEINSTTGNFTPFGAGASMLASPAFSSPTATTQSPGDSTTKVATTAFVQTALGSGSLLQNYLTGFLPTSMTFSSSTVSSMTITAGQAADSTNAKMLSGGSFSWNVTNGNAANGYQGGTTLPNSSTIHFYVITKSDLSSPASFASTSLTPTLPTGYSSGYYRRVFSLLTNGSGVLLGAAGSGGTAIEISGGAMLFYVTTQVLDVSTSSLSTTRTAYTTSAPAGIKVQLLYRASGSANTIILTSGDESDVAPASVSGGKFSSAPGYDIADAGTYTTSGTTGAVLITNTSGQINARANGSSTNLALVTRGWIDFRRS